MPLKKCCRACQERRVEKTPEQVGCRQRPETERQIKQRLEWGVVVVGAKAAGISNLELILGAGIVQSMSVSFADHPGRDVEIRKVASLSPLFKVMRKQECKAGQCQEKQCISGENPHAGWRLSGFWRRRCFRIGSRHGHGAKTSRASDRRRYSTSAPGGLFLPVSSVIFR